MRDFLIVSCGQMVSLLGSGLTTFALGVWVYLWTGSVTKFALIAFFTVLPSLLLSPISGALVDRWDRRRTLMLCDGLGAFSSAALLLLFWNTSRSSSALWHLYGLMVFASCASALQLPALGAATTMLVAKQHYGRASGLLQLGVAIAQIASPFLGSLMLRSMKMRGILIADIASFGFSLLTLLAVKFPSPRSPEGAARRSLWQDAAFGWTYLFQRPGLLALLFLFAVGNFNLGMLQALLPPLVLSFASATALGTVLSIAGFGMLAGTLVMGLWGGPQRRIYCIFAGMLAQGLVLLGSGYKPSLPLVAAVAFLYLFFSPLVIGCSQAIWQSKVQPTLQGRVFSVRRMVAQLSLPMAYLLAGPLADRVFEPLLSPGGALAGSVGALVGVGRGRGIGLLFVVLGTLMLAALGFLFTYPPLRNVERELPDALSDAAPAGAPPVVAS
jgi:predicted MFS family arabinose efflux permease